MNKCVILILSTILLSSALIDCSYDLLVFGNSGQFEEFTMNPQLAENDGLIYSTDTNVGTCANGNLKGFTNFKSVITSDIRSDQQFLCSANEILLMGNIVYVENKSPLSGTTSDRYNAFKRRLDCGFYQFKQIFQNIDVNKCDTASKNPLSKKLSDGKYEKLNILVGQEEFSVDIDQATSLITGFVGKMAFYFDDSTSDNVIPKNSERQGYAYDIKNYPSISTRSENGVNVQFLDFTTLPIYCYLWAKMRSENYSNCPHVKNYPFFYNFDQAKKYTERFIQAINSFTSTVNWRILRTQNGIFSVKGASSEDQVFWNVEYDSQTTLLDLIKKNKISMIITGDDKMGQVQLFPWSQLDNLKTKYLNDPTFFVGTQNLAFSVDLSTCPTGAENCASKTCFYNDKFFGGYTESTDCTEKRNLRIHHNPADPSNLLIINSGFSGRKLDIVQSDQRTPTTVFYDRAVPGNYGGVYISLEADLSSRIQFFTQAETFFSLNTINQSDNYTVLDEYTSLKINKTLDIKTFNASQYNTTHIDLHSNYINFNIFSLMIALIFINLF